MKFLLCKSGAQVYVVAPFVLFCFSHTHGRLSHENTPRFGFVQDQETVIQLATAASRCDHVGRFLLRAIRAR